MIAALYVAKDGCYFGLPDVDPWDAARDARTYAGPWPVIAHPPCERWGRYWHGGPSARVRRVKGDDGGCFAAALAAVRTWGGVLEHPADSHAWRAFGLIAPPHSGGWVAAGDGVGWTCRSTKRTSGIARGKGRGSTRWGASCPRFHGFGHGTASAWMKASTARRNAAAPSGPASASA